MATKQTLTAAEKQELDRNAEAAEQALEDFMQQAEDAEQALGQLQVEVLRRVYEVYDVDAKPGSYSLEAFMELLNSDPGSDIAIEAVLPRDHGRNQVIVSRLV